MYINKYFPKSEAMIKFHLIQTRQNIMSTKTPKEEDQIEVYPSQE